MESKLHVGIECLEHSFSADPSTLIRQAAGQLRGIDFDSIAGIGVSGAIVIPTLARGLHKDFCIVRKPGDCHRHHGSEMEIQGTVGRKWVFVDDGLVTGSSLLRVHDVISDTARQHNHHTQFAGAYLYGHGDDPARFYEPSEVADIIAASSLFTGGLARL
jgi:hypothetical protein